MAARVDANYTSQACPMCETAGCSTLPGRQDAVWGTVCPDLSWGAYGFLVDDGPGQPQTIDDCQHSYYGERLAQALFDTI
jgi:hypothetical protein